MRGCTSLLALLTLAELCGGVVVSVGYSRLPAPPRARRTALVLVEESAPSATAAPVAAADGQAAAEDSSGDSDRSTACDAIQSQLIKVKDSEAALGLVETHVDAMNEVNVATSLHRLAVVNKRRRAGRDALLRDPRFEKLVGAVSTHAPELSARSVADVLWSFATLQHWPPSLLKPVLTSVSVHLEAEDFEAQHLSTMVWALAKLECKPTKLLERIEALAAPRVSEMNTQNCANLMWGFAKLNYTPARLMGSLPEALLQPGMLEAAKPVEVSDLALALGLTSSPGQHEPLLSALAARAGPEAALPHFSSRQVVVLIWCFTRLKATACLPPGRIDDWVSAVRAAHEATPLLAHDARNLERSLDLLGVDSSWIKRSEMLNVWADLAEGRRGGKRRDYTDDELKAAFDAIDTDGSGDIDREELLAAIRGINAAAADGTIGRMLTLADKDGDMEVSLDEFKKIMLLRGPGAPDASS